MFGIGYSGNRDERLIEILQTVPNFSTRPSFTVGRGACLSDLDSERLQLIYDGILKVFGKKAAQSYVEMVYNLKVASASAFLIELYDLCNNGWVNKPNTAKQSNGFDVDKNNKGEYTEEGIKGAGFGIMESMFHNGRDETPMIVGKFLTTHGKTKVYYTSDGKYCSYYYG